MAPLVTSSFIVLWRTLLTRLLKYLGWRGYEDISGGIYGRGSITYIVSWCLIDGEYHRRLKKLRCIVVSPHCGHRHPAECGGRLAGSTRALLQHHILRTVPSRTDFSDPALELMQRDLRGHLTTRQLAQ